MVLSAALEETCDWLNDGFELACDEPQPADFLERVIQQMVPKEVLDAHMVLETHGFWDWQGHRDKFKHENDMHSVGSNTKFLCMLLLVASS